MGYNAVEQFYDTMGFGHVYLRQVAHYEGPGSLGHRPRRPYRNELPHVNKRDETHNYIMTLPNTNIKMDILNAKINNLLLLV